MHLVILQKTGMFILFSISALCFFALVAATIAIAGHTCFSQKPIPPKSDFAQHLFAAAEAQNSRVLPSVRHQTVNEILAKKSRDLSSERVSFEFDTHAHQSTASKLF